MAQPTSSITAWNSFFAHCLITRLAISKFRAFAVLLQKQSPLSSIRICDLLLRPPIEQDGIPIIESLDPRVPGYLVELLKEGIVDITAALRVLRRWSGWNGIEDAVKRGERRPWRKSAYGDEAVLYSLTKLIGQREHGPDGEKGATDLVRATTEWASMLAGVQVAIATGDGSDEDNKIQELQIEISNMRIAFGTFLVGVQECPEVLGALQRGCPKGMSRMKQGVLLVMNEMPTMLMACLAIIKEFSQALAIFTPTLLNSQAIAQRIELFRTTTLVPLEPVDKKMQAANDEMNEILESAGLGIDSVPVVDLPLQTTRAGLYVYLNSLLVGRPMIDDNAIFNYLNNRYQGGTQTTFVDLIGASFDVLANAIFRKEPAQTTMIFRSFLINKLPLLLVPLSASLFPPLTAEFCITQALSSVDTNAFPTFSSMFDESSSGNPFGDSVRQDFCFSCCLHGLIEESSIERLLGEIPMQTLPAGGRYTSQDLVQQSLKDPERVESLIEEIEHMDGNVGAVCQAVTEIIGQLCRTKETMALKTLCTHLARKPSSLDIMLLFEKPSAILQPLCELLDNWHHDEDLGEYQPVYEEFGGILLLVMAFVYRYNLSAADLGIQSNDSFVAKYLIKGTLGRTMDQLSDSEKSHLDVWIRGLFNAEGGGLGDEPMSQCPPQDFYMLVPTLFHHIVLACSTNHLNDEGLKGGLEFLVDTFLLPSLVGAIIWLADHLWESVGDSNAIITILETLIQPSSISSEASSMLGGILNIVAKPLERSLRYLQRSEPSRQDIAPLSKALAPHLGFLRTSAAMHTELESWTSTAGGGLVISIRHTIQNLVTWSLTPGLNVMPTPYTHRQMLAALRMLGAKRMLDAIVEEVKQQSTNGSGSAVLDVAVAIICAPQPSAAAISQPLDLMLDPNGAPHQVLQHRLTLREALQREAENAPKIHKDDVPKREAIIRLQRRVEAQLQMQVPGMGGGIGGMEMQNQHAGLLNDMAGIAGGMQDQLDMSGAAGMSLGNSTQNIDDAIAAAGAGDMMSLGSLGGMGDDLLGGMDIDLNF